MSRVNCELRVAWARELARTLAERAVKTEALPSREIRSSPMDRHSYTFYRSGSPCG